MSKNSKGQSYYEVYSGDSQPIHIVQGKRHIENKPDVVWEYKGKPSLTIEIALTEEWRTTVGEITLAYLTKGCEEILLITANWDETYIKNLVSLIGDKLKQASKRPFYTYCINLDENQLKDLEEIKRLIKKTPETMGLDIRRKKVIAEPKKLIRIVE
jgi:hypothetical protein